MSYLIDYRDTLTHITPDHLSGFFVGWPNGPTPETHYRLLQGSQHFLLARDRATGMVVGFITALSDGVLCAYIPLLEVLPAYQGAGIGGQLVERMLRRLANFYMVDLLCDAELQPYYARFAMRPATGMMVRNYAHQAGHVG